MHRLLRPLALIPGLLLAQAPNDLTGRWIITSDYHGTPLYNTMELIQEGDKLSGQFGGNALQGNVLEGAANVGKVHFVAKGQRGNTATFDATEGGNALSGAVTFTDADDPEHPETRSFTASLIPKRREAPPERHEFTPTVFYRQFSALNKPVLRVWPGDTIHTTTVDAGGTDEKGRMRVLGGNPETGPFYVETAAPGDTLVVHLTRLRLNRDWAISDDALVERALDSDLAAKMKGTGKGVRWHLDRERGVATPEKPGEHLTQYTVPLRPMLGCVATAAPPAQAAPPTGDSGRFGGNMDFNELAEGATLYLPVSVPGALLYFGDGHAAQGDGELNGNALETSMDVELTVDVIANKRISGPRVESTTHIMAMGLSGSIDDAFRLATDNMAQWLAEDYKLTPSEIAQVLGTAAEYRIGEVADRNAGIVVKIAKERLSSITAPVK